MSQPAPRPSAELSAAAAAAMRRRPSGSGPSSSSSSSAASSASSGGGETIEVRRKSSEIIAGAEELRQRYRRQAERAAAAAAAAAGGAAPSSAAAAAAGGAAAAAGAAGDKKAKKEDLRAELNMTEHTVSLEELCGRLDTDAERGLSAATAAARLRADGPNKLSPPKTKSEWRKLLEQMTGLFSLMLWGGSILCFVAYGLQSSLDYLYLGIVLAVVVFVTGLFSYFQERKSSELMATFKSMMADYATVVRDGEVQRVNAIELVRGDVVELKAGDKIPADIRVLSCSDDMQVDNSSLTGESEPQKRSPKCTDENPLETKNLAFLGTQVPKGSCRGMIVNTGDNTVIGRIARLSSTTEQKMTPIANEIHHFVVIISIFAVTVGLIFFILGIIIRVDWITNLVFVIGIIVANVPEGLLATVTVCLARAANRMATKAVLVKNLESVETLGSVSCICSDKTGTLTQNMMTVANVAYDLRMYDCECSMHARSTVDTASASFRMLHRCAVLCNNARWDKASRFEAGADGQPDEERPVPFMRDVLLGNGSVERRVAWRPVGDASESALIKFAQPMRGIDEMRAEFPKLKEIPFNSANKYQISVHRVASTGQHMVVMKGAPERIVERCSHAVVGGEIVEFTDEMRAAVDSLQLNMSKNGLRVLGFAEKMLNPAKYADGYEYSTDNPNFPLGESWRNPDALDKARVPPPNPEVTEPLVFIGLMALIDPPRPQVPDAVARCKTAGIRVIMVTGDHPVTAKAIAKKVGIIWGETAEDIAEDNAAKALREGDAAYRDPLTAPAIVVPGWDISLDTPVEVWDDILDHSQVVFARTSPQQKLIIVENCQRRGDIVAVTGDGVNDAPALRKADIGIAMGIMGSDVSKEAASMILLDDNFASIVSGIEEGRIIFDNLKKTIAYVIASNIPELVPFLAFIIVQLPLPLSTVLILCIDLGTDIVPSVAMAWESAESDIMKRPPRDPKRDLLVTRRLLSFSYFQIGPIENFAGFFAYFIVLHDYGYPVNILSGAGAYDNWGKQVLYCKLTGGVWRDLAGTSSSVRTATHLLWDPVDNGVVEQCEYAARNFLGGSDQPAGWSIADPSTYGFFTDGFYVVTQQAIDALTSNGFQEYIPWRAHESPFWQDKWLYWPITNGDVPGLGLQVDAKVHFQNQPIGHWVANLTGPVDADRTPDAVSAVRDILATVPSLGDRVFKQATLSHAGVPVGADGVKYVNVASRMCQSEALVHAQTAFFIAIVITQWADVLTCKTRIASLFHQGMRNGVINFGIIFETILSAFLCYCPGINAVLGFRELRLLHWVPGVPFAILLLVYDELRKYIMRRTTKVEQDTQTGQIYRYAGWMERNTYY